MKFKDNCIASLVNTALHNVLNFPKYEFVYILSNAGFIIRWVEQFHFFRNLLNDLDNWTPRGETIDYSLFSDSDTGPRRPLHCTVEVIWRDVIPFEFTHERATLNTFMYSIDLWSKIYSKYGYLPAPGKNGIMPRWFSSILLQCWAGKMPPFYLWRLWWQQK